MTFGFKDLISTTKDIERQESMGKSLMDMTDTVAQLSDICVQLFAGANDGDDLYDEKGVFQLSAEFKTLLDAALGEMEVMDREEFESYFKDIAALKKEAS